MLDGIAVILYQPEDVVNVAGVVRAMSNFGLRHLRLVQPAAWDPYRILGIAHRCEELVTAARHFPDLQAAVADCGLLVATTGKPEQLREQPRRTPRELAPLLLARAAAHPQQPVGLLFGRERDGLPNQALMGAHHLLSIPTAENPSLNLAQAVLVVAYELWLAATAAAGEPAPAAPAAPPSRRQALEEAVSVWFSALYPRSPVGRLGRASSRLVQLLWRAAPTEAELSICLSLFTYAARRLGANPPSPAVGTQVDVPGEGSLGDGGTS